MTDSVPPELPRPWLPVVVATYVALGILFVGIAAVQYGLFVLSGYYAEELPEYEHLRIPMFALMFSGGLCVQAGVVATAVLVGRVRSGRILEPGAIRWVDLLVGAVTIAGLITVALVIVMRVADALPPGAMLILVLGGVGLLVLDLLLLVLRSLLRRAIVMRGELDEVV
jgi:hypothetical protein